MLHVGLMEAALERSARTAGSVRRASWSSAPSARCRCWSMLRSATPVAPPSGSRPRRTEPTVGAPRSVAPESIVPGFDTPSPVRRTDKGATPDVRRPPAADRSSAGAAGRGVRPPKPVLRRRGGPGMTQNPGQWGPQGGYPPQGQGGYPPQRPPPPGYPPQPGYNPAGHVRPAGRLPAAGAARWLSTTGAAAARQGTGSRSVMPPGGMPPAGRPAGQEEPRPDHRHRGRGRGAARRDRRHHHGAQPRRQRPAAAGVDHPDRAGAPD